MRIMQVKCRLHKFVLHKFFIALYIIIHETIKRIKLIKILLISRDARFDSHNFFMHILMSLYGILHFTINVRT